MGTEAVTTTHLRLLPTALSSMAAGMASRAATLALSAASIVRRLRHTAVLGTSRVHRLHTARVGVGGTSSNLAQVTASSKSTAVDISSVRVAGMESSSSSSMAVEVGMGSPRSACRVDLMMESLEMRAGTKVAAAATVDGRGTVAVAMAEVTVAAGTKPLLLRCFGDDVTMR